MKNLILSGEISDSSPVSPRFDPSLGLTTLSIQCLDLVQEGETGTER
jgi:hypothetical protein